jgi:phosphoribosylaminoimidazole carboxylase (NCAIR synthetase)
MDVSKQVASDEKMIEELFERLEIATNEFERITQETDEKLETL